MRPGQEAEDSCTDKPETNLRASFGKLLNRHGYGFQYSVLKVAQDLYVSGQTKWVFEASEFPVTVGGDDTRIDFILRLGSPSVYMVAECKRADPKFANWCFVRAPYVRRNRSAERFLLDSVECEPGMFLVDGEELDELDASKAFHIGLPLKSRAGEGESPKGRNAIEEAAGQVCRGLNGLIELLWRRRPSLPKGQTRLIPVIFTTAKLWSSKCDLSTANIEDGYIELSERELSPQDWLYYQYHMSPGLKHCAPLGRSPKQLAERLGYEFIRTIPVVTAGSVESFLKCFDPTSWSSLP
jgi:hypothetical protein